MADPIMPAPIAALPRDKHGRPIPWFVVRDVDGTPDFRQADGIRDAFRFGWCWVCGTPRGRHAAFVIGPMCGINRVSAEPPSHLDCAIYSALACPFLSRPEMVRRPRGLGPLNEHTPGVAIERNPGVTLVWSSKTWHPFAVFDGSGALFDIGAPTAVRWYARGRDATRDEVIASIETGLPLLREACQGDRDPADSLASLQQQVANFAPLLPSTDTS